MIKPILRWIAVLPAAALGATLAGMAVYLVNWFTWPVAMYAWNLILWWPVSTYGFPFKLFIGITRGYVFGYSFIFIAEYVAPSHKKRIALVACALILALGVIVVWHFWANGDYWAIFETIVACGASISGAHGVITYRASET